MDDKDKLCTVKDVCSYLHVADSTIRKWIKDGDLPALIVGRKSVRIRESDLAKIMHPKIPAQATA